MRKDCFRNGAWLFYPRALRKIWTNQRLWPTFTCRFQPTWLFFFFFFFGLVDRRLGRWVVGGRRVLRVWNKFLVDVVRLTEQGLDCLRAIARRTVHSRSEHHIPATTLRTVPRILYSTVAARSVHASIWYAKRSRTRRRYYGLLRNSVMTSTSKGELRFSWRKLFLWRGNCEHTKSNAAFA